MCYIYTFINLKPIQIKSFSFTLEIINRNEKWTQFFVKWTKTSPATKRCYQKINCIIFLSSHNNNASKALNQKFKQLITLLLKIMLHTSNKNKRAPGKKNIHHKSNQNNNKLREQNHAHTIQSTFYTDLTVRHRIPNKLYLWTWSSSPRRPGREVRWLRPSRVHCCRCCVEASGSTVRFRCCCHSQVLPLLLSKPLHGDRTLACLCNRLASTSRRLDH